MQNELIIAVIGIVLAAMALGSGDSSLMLLAFVIIIGVGMYSGHHYKGQKNWWYSLGVFGAFLVFMVSSSYPGGVICTLILFAFLGLVCYLAWWSNRVEPTEQ
jgi:uncharacterized membrane protein YdcZ (DUF606 family)